MLRKSKTNTSIINLQLLLKKKKKTKSNITKQKVTKKRTEKRTGGIPISIICI